MCVHDGNLATATSNYYCMMDAWHVVSNECTGQQLAEPRLEQTKSPILLQTTVYERNFTVLFDLLQPMVVHQYGASTD